MKKLLFLLLVLPVFAFAQVADFSQIQIPPSSPLITISPNSAFSSTFTSVAPTPSGTQPITYLFQSLTGANGAIGLPSWAEGSIDGGLTYHASFSGLSSSSGTLLVRIAGATTAGSYGPTNVSFTATGATTQNCSASATVSPTPTLTVSPTSLTGVTASAPSAGSASTITATFANPIGNFTVSTVAPLEVSVDGGTTYGTSKNFNSGSPLAVKTRIAAGGTSGSGSTNVSFTGTSFTTVNVPVAWTITSGTVSDTLLVQIWDSVGHSGASGEFLNAAWNNWAVAAGVLTSANLKKTDGTVTGMQLSVNSFNDMAGNGATYGNTNTMGFPAGVMVVSLYNTAGMTFTLTGIPATTGVKVDIVSSTAVGSGSPAYNQTFTSGSSSQSLVNAYQNLTNLVQLDNLTPSSGTITISVTPTSNIFTVVQAFRIIIKH